MSHYQLPIRKNCPDPPRDACNFDAIPVPPRKATEPPATIDGKPLARCLRCGCNFHAQCPECGDAEDRLGAAISVMGGAT